jgi:2-amino-4-hydroxy-6-hydroxymethyldihydropteridine diphosphokinase
MGNSEALLAQARTMISDTIGSTLKTSKIYKTAPWGKTDQDWFLNQAILLNTELEPSEILSGVHSIEKEIGRERKEKWGARLIDVDILLAGDLVLMTPELTLPHPYLHLRRFTLIPLQDVLPEWEHPSLHQNMQQLLDHCPDKSEVLPSK